MNSATRLVANLENTTDGTAEVAADRLLFKVASVAMASSDDASHPYRHTFAYLESLLPGSIAVNRLRTRYAAQLAQEATKV
jgi:hypothetical protein